MPRDEREEVVDCPPTARIELPSGAGPRLIVDPPYNRQRAGAVARRAGNSEAVVANRASRSARGRRPHAARRSRTSTATTNLHGHYYMVTQLSRALCIARWHRPCTVVATWRCLQ